MPARGTADRPGSCWWSGGAARAAGDDRTSRAGQYRPASAHPARTQQPVRRARNEPARGRGRAISCRAGCGACCRQLVPLAPSEARALAVTRGRSARTAPRGDPRSLREALSSSGTDLLGRMGTRTSGTHCARQPISTGHRLPVPRRRIRSIHPTGRWLPRVSRTSPAENCRSPRAATSRRCARSRSPARSRAGRDWRLGALILACVRDETPDAATRGSGDPARGDRQAGDGMSELRVRLSAGVPGEPVRTGQVVLVVGGERLPLELTRAGRLRHGRGSCCPSCAA